MSTTRELRRGWFLYALTQCRDNSTVAVTDDEITAEWGLVRAERLSELERENARMLGALQSSEAWLTRWGAHAGECRGWRSDDACTCGLVAIRHEARAALAGSGEK